MTRPTPPLRSSAPDPSGAPVRGGTSLFERLCAPEHLEDAARSTVRGKRRRPDVAWFLFRRESELARLSEEFRAGTWRPRRFELLFVRDPKPRVIARAPIEDRVVHAAIVELVEPLFARSFLPDAFACRPGLGTHRALLRLLEYVRRFRFALHLDIRSYFASVDVGCLRSLLTRRIRDERLLDVLDLVLRSGAGLFDSPRVRRFARMDPDWPPLGRGLPIGARTSQLFAAQIYLDGLDHHVKRELKVPGYVRYVDDLYLFGRSRGEMRRWRRQVADWLHAERGLRLKAPEARVLACAGHLDALGHRVRRVGIEPLPREPYRRVVARLRHLRRGGQGFSAEQAVRSVESAAADVFFGC